MNSKDLAILGIYYVEESSNLISTENCATKTQEPDC